MSLTPAPAGRQPTASESAVLVGSARLGEGSHRAQGVVVRAASGAVEIGAHSAVLENSVVIGAAFYPVRIGQRSVFGHRCLIVGAQVGDLCEIGNGTVLMPGSRLGDGVILGEGTVVPAGTVLGNGAVAVGRPARVVRTANEADRARVAALRDHDLSLTDAPLVTQTARGRAGAGMGSLYAYRGVLPQVAPDAVLFDSAELTGDVIVGPGTLIGAGVKIIGDSHGPVRIGAHVQILENTVLHLLPDNELVIEDDVVIGPGAMIHGCRLGAGSVVEPGAIVCDWSVVGAGSLVSAGSCVKQRARFPELSVLDGFPAVVTGTLDAPPARPAWTIRADDLPVLAQRG